MTPTTLSIENERKVLSIPLSTTPNAQHVDQVPHIIKFNRLIEFSRYEEAFINFFPLKVKQCM